MNRKKIIFLMVGIILVFSLLYFISTLTNTKKTNHPSKKSNNPFVIWVFNDNKTDFQKFLSEFKANNKKYLNTSITVESFSDYEDYFFSLTSAFNKGLGPDLFVLNNNEKSVLQEQALGLDPNVISPNNFRKDYKGVFSDDLILKDSNTEYLIGIPIGYESLGVFYNRRYFNSEDLKTWAAVNNRIYDLTKKGSKVTPMGIGNGTTVALSEDIISQFFALEGVNSLQTLSSNNIKQALSLYQYYGDKESENAYNSKLPISSEKNNLDLFSSGDIAAIIGYPRTLKEIDKRGYNDKFLLATPFPKYAKKNPNKTFINYNYFSLSRDSDNIDLGVDLLKFMSTRIGAAAYLNNFQYYLPAITLLQEEVMEQKINSDYNIVYKDFYDRETDLTSFDKGIKIIYDKEIKKLLDTNKNMENLFEKFKRVLVCKTNKALKLTNISSTCK